MATPCMPRLKLAAVALLSMCTRVQGFSATSMAKGLCSPGDGKTLMRVSNCGSDSACQQTAVKKLNPPCLSCIKAHGGMKGCIDGPAVAHSCHPNELIAMNNLRQCNSNDCREKAMSTMTAPCLGCINNVETQGHGQNISGCLLQSPSTGPRCSSKDMEYIQSHPVGVGTTATGLLTGVEGGCLSCMMGTATGDTGGPEAGMGDCFDRNARCAPQDAAYVKGYSQCAQKYSSPSEDEDQDGKLSACQAPYSSKLTTGCAICVLVVDADAEKEGDAVALDHSACMKPSH